MVGNDFGTAYPAAWLGITRFWGRVGVGSALHLIRIAGAHGSGDYGLQWAPVRLTLRL